MSDPIRAALADLRDSALPLVRPPGVEQAGRTLRRRRGTRAASAALLTAGLAVSATLLPSIAPTPIDPATATPTTTASVDPSGTGSASPSVSSSGSVAGQGSAGCSKLYIIDNGSDGTTVTINTVLSPDRNGAPCAGDRIKLTYISYSLEQDGSQTLFTSKVIYIYPSKKLVSFAEQRPAGECYGESYTVQGNVAVKSTLPAGAPAGQSYPRDKNNRAGEVTHLDLDRNCPYIQPGYEPPTTTPSP